MNNMQTEPREKIKKLSQEYSEAHKDGARITGKATEQCVWSFNLIKKTISERK